MSANSVKSAIVRTICPTNAKTVNEQYTLILFSSVMNTIDNINVG